MFSTTQKILIDPHFDYSEYATVNSRNIHTITSILTKKIQNIARMSEITFLFIKLLLARTPHFVGSVVSFSKAFVSCCVVQNT